MPVQIVAGDTTSAVERFAVPAGIAAMLAIAISTAL
jgi:hypothetical protein